MNNKLFRFFDIVSKQYIYKDFDFNSVNNFCYSKKQDEELKRTKYRGIEMFSGICDKNGNKVYENDIISFNGQTSEVFFHSGAFCVWVSCGYLELSRISHEIEVTGNFNEFQLLLMKNIIGGE